MNEINNLLEFLYENINDERIEVSRKIKYGFKYYFISVRIDIDSKSGYKTYNAIQLTIDNRNKCIELEVNMDTIVLENDDLVIKWSNILEGHLNDKLEDDARRMINDVLGSGINKDLLREYQLKKIIK